MKKNRSDLEIKLFERFKVITATDPTEYYEQLEEKYNLPVELSSDIFCGRRFISEQNELILYWITAVIAPRLAGEYFTKAEIKAYDVEQYSAPKLKFPLKFQMIEITNDQWIGKIDVKTLMELRDAQKIRYNAATQRALRVLVKGETAIYEPYINQSSVDSIQALLSEDNFIPNTLTFNISDTNDADYDYKNGYFIIKELTYLDIVDGYHRYLAIGAEYDKNPNFNINFEIRITTFSVGKARRFISQEDHKNRMRKIDAVSYDQNDTINNIIDRLNQDVMCNLHNQINNGVGLVRSGLAASGLKIAYKHEKFTIKDVIQKEKELMERINSFTNENSTYLEKRWEEFKTIIIFYGLGKELTNDAISKIIDGVMQNKDDLKIIKRFISGNQCALEPVFSKHI